MLYSLTMTWKEELYAKQLHQELLHTFYGGKNIVAAKIAALFNRKNAVKVTVKGAGVHWHCRVAYGERYCDIHCFDVNQTNVEYTGPEYLITFVANDSKTAEGRTFNKKQTIEAVQYWLRNAPPDEMYSRFSFIDEEKRTLQRIRAEIIALYPELATIKQSEVVEEDFGSYTLWFKHINRSCNIDYHGYGPYPRFVFEWDDSRMFETSGADIGRLGYLVKKWVVDEEKPSVLKTAFTDVDFGKLVKYYEEGNGIEGEFMASWDDITQFYETIDIDQREQVGELIRVMRSKGFDKTLRAGTSLYSFILSRSRRHGLENEQHRIVFSFVFIKSKMEVRVFPGETVLYDTIEYNDAIDGWLKTLEQQPID
jgi:hypothetical protein